ncbi:MAG TPA: trypsin-like peptidase domain-containing protein [Caulifigura sp.]|jgi:S1-C subfamily serine protease|nr:trypsin-like peptidase domain-containing protein [Caulifigura sp.]
MRTLGISFGSAILASLFTVWLTGRGQDVGNEARADVPGGRRAAAQEFAEQSLETRLPAIPGLGTSSFSSPDEAINIAVYERCNKSVVNISTVTVVSNSLIFGVVPGEGNGSGSILDKQGHILTNNHVVNDARQIQVTLFNEEQYEAELVGADPINDIAVLKIKAPPEQLYPMSLGDSDELKVGLRVFALGNPFGLFRTMSEGIISSLNRSLAVHENWEIKSIIQIDANINPGNSGGPLLDAQGRLIGMNTAIASKVQQSAGIGFAIPVNLVKRVVPELLSHGRVIRGDIGITHVTVTENGLRVARLSPGGPAEKAGVRAPQTVRQRFGPLARQVVDKSTADVITAIDGTKVTNASEFLGVIESKKPGDVVELSVLREGRQLRLKIRLGSDDQRNNG